MKKYLAITCLVLFRVLLFSQGMNEKSVLVKMNEAYLNATSLGMDVKIDMFQKGQLKPYQNMGGTVKKDGHFFYSEIMQRITLNNDNCFLVVDVSQKKIYYNAHANNGAGVKYNSKD